MNDKSINSNELLTSLINSGSDAAKNLFRVVFFTNEDSGVTNSTLESKSTEFMVRNTKFDAPQIKMSLVDIPYYNFKYKKTAPSFESDKTLAFTIRIDQDYELYKFLKYYLDIDENGKYTPLDNKYFNLKVEVLKPNNQNYTYDVSKTWIFSRCSLVGLDRINYNYNDSNPVTVQVTMVYGTYNFN